MTLLSRRQSVRQIVRVVVSSGALARQVADVAEFVNVDCVFLVRCEARKHGRDLYLPAFQRLKVHRTLTLVAFRWLHNSDEMAVAKLGEGIRLFDRDARKLEAFARDKLQR